MFVMSCTTMDATFDPPGVRWGDLQNDIEWTAYQTGMAGQARLAVGGSYIVAGRTAVF